MAPQQSAQHTQDPSVGKEASPWVAKVSAFRSANDTAGMQLTLIDAIQYATGHKQKQVVKAIRRARKVALEQADKKGLEGRERSQHLKKATEHLKRGLWGFTPTGVYKGGRKASNARDRTEAVMVEADHLGSFQAARAAVHACTSHPAIMAAWVSPSGDGVKILVWIKATEGDAHRRRHAFATEVVFGPLGPLAGIQDDTCYRNEHLLCFGSYDPDAHIRTVKLKALEIPEEWNPVEEQPDGAPSTSGEERTSDDDMLDAAEMVQVLAQIPPDCLQNPDLTDRQQGEARDQWIRVGMAIHSRMPGDAGLQLWDKWSRGGLGANALTGEVPGNYDARALKTSWRSFQDSTDGVSWATAVRLGRQWETAKAARKARNKSSKGKEAPTEKTDIGELSGNPDILELVHYLVRAYYAQDCVMVRATGERSDSGAPAELAAKRIAVEIRTQFRMQVPTNIVNDAIEVEGSKQAGFRRERLTAKVVGAKRGTEAGKQEVRKWLKAVTGSVDKLDEAVLLHILRNIKLKLTGQKAMDHKALILYQLQRSGKSTAIERLLSPLEELVYSETSLKKMIDERGLRRFGRYAAIIWDEMAGARGRDVEEHVDTLKALATGHEVTYRPMATNSDVTIKNTATLFGSTNRPVADVIKDPTGNRRFWQITTLPKIDWAAINAIDYELLWSAIGVKDASPIADKNIDEAVMAKHTATRYKDPVEQWTEAGEWGKLRDIRRPGSVTVCDLKAITEGTWYQTADLYARFCVWCAANGVDRPVNATWFGRRISALGWTAARRSVGGLKAHGYISPVVL